MVDLYTIVHLSIFSMHKPVATKRSEFNTHCRSIFHLGVSRINTPSLMTTASFALQIASNGPIGTHCTIPIVSTLVILNLLTTRISHCPFYPQVLILRMTPKFSRTSASSDKFHTLTVLPHSHI